MTHLDVICLPPMSEHQQRIIQLLENHNVVVDSVAGSGKTTSNLHIAQHFSHYRILLLTYNAKLKVETREKVIKYGITNMEIHSYHSFCVKHYDPECFNDTQLEHMLREHAKRGAHTSIHSGFIDPYQLIVIDEAQDMSPLYYRLICKIFSDNRNPSVKICVLGDKKQSIFDFNLADSRFITHANMVFSPFNSYKWTTSHLPVSFRITHEMAEFINHCMLHDNRIQSHKVTGILPRYIKCDTFDPQRTFQEILYYLSLGYKPCDIFVLAPSVRNNPRSPVCVLENWIKKRCPDAMIYVPTNDNEKLDETLLKGKMIFSTFHQTKGLERKVVIVFGMDESYFQCYKKHANPFVCPNELYVATTRASERLTMIHHYKHACLPFINEPAISTYCVFEDKKLNAFDNPNRNKRGLTKEWSVSVTNLLRHLPQFVIDECYELLEVIPLSHSAVETTPLYIPQRTTNHFTTESVSDITGIAIPSMYELKLKGTMTILNELLNDQFDEKKFYGTATEYNGRWSSSPVEAFMDDGGCWLQLLAPNTSKQYRLKNIQPEQITADELLYVANCWNSYTNGYIFKMYQITDYNWLRESTLCRCLERIDQLRISPTSHFEKKYEVANQDELMNRQSLVGVVDCFDAENYTIYEFKCVQSLDKEHFLQLALYKYLYEMSRSSNDDTNTSPLPMKYVLFNILTNERVEIRCPKVTLVKIVQRLIRAKYDQQPPSTDAAFLKQTDTIRKEMYRTEYECEN